jgi:phage FluMu gp28-like protein
MVSIYDAVNDGLPLDIEELRTALDDPYAWAQEYECQPTDTSNVLLPYDLIAFAESPDATEMGDADFLVRTRNPLFCGIDFGRTNDPTVCWSLELIGDILWTREVLVLRNMDTADQNAILASRIKASRRTVLDYTGPGIGFGDYAAKEFQEYKPEDHLFGRVEKFTFTAKSKRLLFPTLRRHFEAPCKLRIPISRMVREDLHAMQQVVTSGEYNYWAPVAVKGTATVAQPSR